MKRTVSIKCGEYELKAEEFGDWVEALTELILGSTIMKISFVVGHSALYDSSAPLQFPKDVLTSKERIVCALLLRYPKGLSKENLQNATGMKSDSLATYLSSKQEGLAEGFEKIEDTYAIKKEMIGWALKIASEAISKCDKQQMKSE